jgi:hypothetical protein
VTEATRLLDDQVAYDAMALIHSPYGDGRACERIAERLAEESSKLARDALLKKNYTEPRQSRGPRQLRTGADRADR